METINRELPLSVWYPITIEPEIGEPIMFCSMGCVKYYVEVYAATSFETSMPNEVKFGSYLGNGLAEIHPLTPPLKIGVWMPMPLFFSEASIKSLITESNKKTQKRNKSV